MWVWYRTSEGCPDGEAFVSRLAALGKAARLASVGDRVDFVVTLGRGPRESSGRLERQTRGGTVAIREYRDARCDAVAEALALTLDLALEPEAAPVASAPRAAASSPPSSIAARSVAAGAVTGASAADGVAAVASAPPPRSGVPARSPSADDGAQRALANPDAPPAGALAIGAQALLQSGVAPGALPGAALFLARRTPAPWLSSWRATLTGAHRESAVAGRDLEVLLAGVRLEGCTFQARFDAVAVALAPCLGLDAGLLRARGSNALGAADAGFWSALAAHGRLDAALTDELSLELQIGALLPLFRYEMGTLDGSADWYRTRAIGLDARVGAAWRIP